MPLNKQAITYFDFVRGLNTEVSPLAAEPNDIIDMDNCTIHIEKAIAVRNGYEFLGTNSDGSIYKTPTTDFSTYNGTFQYPALNFKKVSLTTDAGTAKNFVILQAGGVFNIYDYDNFYDLSAVDNPLYSYTISDADGRQSFHRSTYSVIGDKIFVANKYDTFGYFEYDESGNTFSWTAVTVKVRDLEQNAAVDSVVNYSGFAYQCILSHTSATANDRPSTGTNWEDYWKLIGPEITGKSAWADVTAYTSSVITNPKDTGYAFCVIASQRMWLAGSPERPNAILYSQTIVEGDEYNRFYQYADPKSADDSDLVDTDGGELILHEITFIRALHPFKNGVLILADNGIWYVGGQDKSFTPTNYTIVKVSDDGCVSNSGVVGVEDFAVYLGYSGVYAVKLDDLSAAPSVTSLTDAKITSLYNSISLYNKYASKIIYDPTNKEIRIYTNLDSKTWFLDSNVEKQPTVFRNVLFYNLRLEAWYKHSLVEDTDGSKVYTADVVMIDGGVIAADRVTDNSDNLVVDALDNQVISLNLGSNDTGTLVPLYLFAKKSSNNISYAFGVEGTTYYQDFLTSTNDTEDYDASFTTAYQIFKDVAHKKQTPYIYPIFKRLETGIINEDTGEDLTSGSCLLRVDWDFANTSGHPKYGTDREVYLPYRTTYGIFDGSLPGTDLVISKIKLRGRGRSVQLTFSKNGVKGFYLYGFQLEMTASQRV